MRKSAWADRALAALDEFSRDLARAGEIGAVLEAIVAHGSRAFECRVAILLAGPDERLAPVAASPDFELAAGEQAAVAELYRERAGAGQHSDRDAVTDPAPLPGVLCRPLRTPNGTLGMLCLGSAPQGRAAPGARSSLLEIFCNQAALAIERAQLAGRNQEIELLQATEKLQAALLNSITHDLRTPLAIITVALGNLETAGERLDEATRRSLARTGREEAERLNRLLGELLEISRIEAGALRIVAELCDIEEVIGVALDHLAPEGGWPGLDMASVADVDERPIFVELAPGLPAVRLDLVLMAQALINVLDNAVKYSPPGTQIDIRAQPAGNEVEIQVADRGAGMRPEESAQIFDKFYRGQWGDTAHGSGLGLAISKGIVEAHGGRIWATERAGGGTVVTIALPAPRATADGEG